MVKRILLASAIILCSAELSAAQDNNTWITPEGTVGETIHPPGVDANGAVPIDPTGQDADATADVGEIDWGQVQQARCDASVDEVINKKTLALSIPGKLEYMSPVAEKRRFYNWIAIAPNRIMYDLRGENDYATKGTTMCVCAEFQDSRMQDFPIVALGGRYGLNGRKKRSDRKSISLDPRIIEQIDQVTIVAGYCPTNRIVEKTGKAAIKIGWTALRAYMAAKTGVVLPKDPPN